MMNQNLSNMSFPSDQLNHAFQKLEISKPLDQKKDEYLKDIRSQKRKTHLKTKRLTAVNSLSSQLDQICLQEDTLGQGLSLREFIAECQERTFTLTVEELNELVASIYSVSLYRQYFGVIGIRKLLATVSPPIQPLIDAGVIPQLIEFLSREDEPQLQAEAAWALSNLSSGSTKQAQQVVENGAIPALIKLLRSPHHDVKLQALWPLGNLAGDSVIFRDAVLQGGAIGPLVEILDRALFEGDKYMIRDGSWALANLCRGKSPFEDMKETISVFAKVIMSQEDLEILKDAVWCMLSLSDGGNLERIIDTGVLPYIVKLMDKGDFSVLVACLRTIGNICLGSHEQVDVIYLWELFMSKSEKILLKIPGIMDKLFSALVSQKKAVRKDAALVIANITKGTPDHLEYIVGNPEYLEQLFYVGINDIQEIQKEIAVGLNNAIEIANKEQMRILLEKKELFVFFGKLLVAEEVGLQKIALAGIWMIWNLKAERAPEGFTKASCWALLEENKILPVLEELQESPSSSIKKLTAHILGAGIMEKEIKK